MKKIISPFFIFAVITTGVFGQFWKSSEKKDKNLELTEHDHATIRIFYCFAQKGKDGMIQIDTMALDVGVFMSEYYCIARKQQDSVYFAKQAKINIDNITNITVFGPRDTYNYGKYWGYTASTGILKESSKIFKNRLTSEIVTIDYISVNQIEKYKYSEMVKPQEWQMGRDTATILRYFCQKATTTFRGRSYEAWFSPEIPVNEGPWKFFGLPGLILKITDSENVFSFVCVGIEHLNPPREIKIEKYNYIDCSHRNELAQIKTRQGRESRFTFTFDGELIFESLKFNDNFYPLELE